MNVNLGATFDKFVTYLIQKGYYQSQSEVVREGLRLLKEREELHSAKVMRLRRDIDKGLNDLENGDFETYDAKSLKKKLGEIKSRGRRKLSKRQSRAA